MTARHIAQGLAGLGRNGDTVLMHVSPEEVDSLQGIAQLHGKSLTTNPHTGLPEAFSLGGVLQAALPMAAGAVLGGPLGMSALSAGLITGAGTALLTGDPMKGVMAGLGGYGGAGLGSSLTNFANSAPAATQTAEVGNAIQGGAQSSAAASEMLKNAGMNATAGLPATGGIGALPNSAAIPSVGAQAPMSGFDALGAGISKAASNPMDYVNYLGGPGKALGTVGYPIGGALLGGIEPGDLGPKPYDPKKDEDRKDKYDPNARLYLGNDTGLRLYASGGPVAFAGGGPLEGGGPGALQGAGGVPIRTVTQNPTPGNPLAQLKNMAPMGGSLATVPVPKAGPFASYDEVQAMNKKYDADVAAANKRMTGLGGLGSGDPWSRMGNLAQLQGLNQQQPSGWERLATMTPMGAQPTKAPEVSGLDTLNLNSAPGMRFSEGGLNSLFTHPDDFDPNTHMMAKGGYLDGQGDGMSDSIPATIQGGQPARLADGEFVVPADVVSHLGNGSTKAGAKQLYAMMDKVRKARTGTKKQGKQINPAKMMP